MVGTETEELSHVFRTPDLAMMKGYEDFNSQAQIIGLTV